MTQYWLCRRIPADFQRKSGNDSSSRLPRYIIESQTMNCFKIRLDKCALQRLFLSRTSQFQVHMGGQHDGLFLSGSPPILYIYIHMYIFLIANKLCCCCCCCFKSFLSICSVLFRPHDRSSLSSPTGTRVSIFARQRCLSNRLIN